ncbi:MAG: AI-2E family transporter [Acetatifactor sp.]|nr:AI-2E family transporter [Acetatifactor sp.]
MKRLLNNQYFKWGFTAFLSIAASVIFIYLIFYSSEFAGDFKFITGILTPVISGLVIAYILTPVMNFIEYKIFVPIRNFFKKDKTNRNGSTVTHAFAILFTIVFFVLLLYGFFRLLISQIVPSIVNITNNFDSYIDNFTKWITRLMSEDYPDLGNKITELVDKYSIEIEDWLNTTVMDKTAVVIKTLSLSVLAFFQGFWHFIIGFIISIYVLASKDRFAGQAKKMVYALFNRDFANIMLNNFSFTNKTFVGFLSGKIMDSIIIGILCFIGTSIMGTPYAALVSVIIGVTNIIPFFGPYLGAIPTSIFILIVTPTVPMNCVKFIIFILLLQQLDGNVIGPKILGESTGLSGFWVIFSLTLFGGLWGIPGMILGVPIFAVIYAMITSYVNALLIKKELSINSCDYINACEVDRDGNIIEFVPDYKLRSKELKNVEYGSTFKTTIEQNQKKRKNDIINFADNTASDKDNFNVDHKDNDESQDIDNIKTSTVLSDSIDSDESHD